MRHLPERHQSVMPSTGFVITIVAIVALMIVVYSVVALAD